VGKCPNCENKGWFLKTYRCFVCGKEGCDGCFYKLLSFETEYTREGALWVCSDACSQAFESKLESTVPPNAISLADYPSDIPHPEQHPYPSTELFEKSLKNIVQQTKLSEYEELASRISRDDLQILADSDIQKQFKRYCDLKQAENLEKAGRRKEAAKIYDQYGMYGKARKLRDTEKQVIVRKTNISVDLNALLQQIKDGGIIVVYRCPNCGGKLKVSKGTNVESLKACEHCGSEIETIELADFLKTALS